MDNLPDQLVWEIFSRITNIADRNSISLVCKRFLNLDNEQRKHIRVDCGSNPANEALTLLCRRFRNLNKVEITYCPWMSKLKKQLEDPELLVLSNACPFLTDLTLSYCTYITDVGLSYLASCSKLSSLKLKDTSRITGSGIFSIVVNCKNLKSLHLVRCLNVTNLEWLECLGGLETLEDLCIKNCSGIGEGALVKLGATWRNIKRLHFEVDYSYMYMKLDDLLAVDQWQKQWVSCDNMVELSLINCMINPGRGLACILDKCKNLEKLHLDMCIGARDLDIIGLARNSRNLRSISISVPADWMMEHPSSLTDDSLKALTENCTLLESLTLSFLDGDRPSPSSFSLNGILDLNKKCSIKNLSLDRVYLFNDIGMEALCCCDHLETLELVRCQEISDEGLELVVHYPRLRVLRLTACHKVSDDGFRPLIVSGKLELLVVNDCRHVGYWGVQGAAKDVSFKPDLSCFH
ncbi:F-box/LRR-repeat protein 14-like [Rutidosis leptorrhynchoides]|uniref:F-box/LRR-repeat protein 14-like n=1 Tax=Rutidosis leptorrhynchoides TaxID=125765 RepID=UPI003A996CB3